MHARPPVSSRVVGRAIALAAGLTVAASLVLGPAASAAAPAAPISGAPSDRLLVTYAGDAAYRAASMPQDATLVPDATLRPLAMRIVAASPGRGTAVARELASRAGVVAVEYDEPIRADFVPNDTYWARYDAWADRAVRLPQAWDVTEGSRSTVIAVLDTGIDRYHRDLAGRVLRGWDFTNNDSNPYDDFGHGTMSAGTAAATGDNGTGVAGACWSCTILPVKVLNSRGSGSASNAIRGIIWAANQGADVISMSFGGFAYSSTFQRAITYARSRGAVVLASAGNQGRTSRFYPGAYAGVISVAATTPSNGVYSWSNRGSWVSVGAPGCLWTTKRFNHYGNFCGTSAATPLVAGIVGLLRSAKPNATVSQIEQALFSTATRKSFVKYGIVNAQAALAKLGAIVSAPPGGTTTAAYRETGGTVVFDAERPDNRYNRSGESWAASTALPGFADTGYVASADLGQSFGATGASASPQLRFRVLFSTPGTYTVYLRGYAPNIASDTVLVGLDGEPVAAGDPLVVPPFFTWTWSHSGAGGLPVTVLVPTAGVHTFDMWVADDGLAVDKIVLSQTLAEPTDTGPADSARVAVP